MSEKIFLLTYLIIYSRSYIFQLEEMSIGIQISEASFFPSLYVIAGRNTSSQRTDVMCLNLDSRQFEMMGSINDSFKLLGNQVNTVGSNNFLVYDSSIQILLASQNFSRWKSLSTIMTSQPIFGQNASSAYWFDYYQPNYYQLKKYDITKKILSTTSTYVKQLNAGMVNQQERIYFYLFVNQVFFVYVAVQTNFSGGDIEVLAHPTTATTSIVKCIQDYLIVGLENYLVIFSVSGNHSNVGNITLGQGIMTDFNGKITDFSLIGSTIFMIINSSIIVQYDFIDRKVLKGFDSGISSIYCINQTHFITWNKGATSIFIGTKKQIEISDNASNVTANVDSNDNNGGKKAAEQTTNIAIRDPLRASQILQQIWDSKKSQFFGQFLILSNLRAIFKPFSPLVCFIEEFWYYKYHYYQYPEFFRIFLEQIDILNYFRLSIPFSFKLPQSYSDYTEIKNEKYNKAIYKSVQNPNAPSERFYLLTFQSFLENILLNIALFLITWVLIIVVYQLSKKFKRLNLLKSELEQRSRFPMLLMNIMNNNIIPLSFYLFIQFQNFFAFEFQDNWNLLFTLLLFFSILIYIFNAYFFFHMIRPKTVQKALQLVKPSQKGYYIEMLLVMISKCAKSVIHSELNGNYEFQIMSLWLIDLISVMVIIRCYREFANKSIFLFTSCYYLSVFAINLLFYIRMNWVWEQKILQKIESAIIILLLILLIITIIRIVLTLIEEVRGLLQLFRRIQPQTLTSKKALSKHENGELAIKQERQVIFAQSQISESIKPLEKQQLDPGKENNQQKNQRKLKKDKEIRKQDKQIKMQVLTHRQMQAGTDEPKKNKI